MNAIEYIKQELAAGRLTAEHIEKLTSFYQRETGLIVDGMPGPKTRASLTPGFTCWPLRALGDGRGPVITSAYRTKDRPTHNGVDLFFHYLDSDPEVKAGDGGAVIRDGKRRWWIPPGTYAVAAAAGEVTRVGRIKTGFRVWIEHSNGLQSGYFHLTTTCVDIGDRVAAGEPIGEVGHNPDAWDARHLHFEASGAHHYSPIDPASFLEGAVVLPALLG